MDLLNILIARNMKEENEEDNEKDLTEEDLVLNKDEITAKHTEALQAIKNGCFAINTFLFSGFVDTQ